MEIIIKKDIFLPFNGKPPIPVPNYGILLGWMNKVTAGTGTMRGWIFIYKKDEWFTDKYNLLMKIRPGMVKKRNASGAPWSVDSLMNFIKEANR